MTHAKTCACGQLPVAAKVRGGYWIVTCPRCHTIGRGPTEDMATVAYNNAVESGQHRKERKK